MLFLFVRGGVAAKTTVYTPHCPHGSIGIELLFGIELSYNRNIASD